MIYMLVFIEKQPMGSEILTTWEFWDTCATSLQSVAPSSHHTLPAVVVTLQQYYCPVTLLVATSYFSLNCYPATDCLFIVPGTHRLKGLYSSLLVVSYYSREQHKLRYSSHSFVIRKETVFYDVVNFCIFLIITILILKTLMNSCDILLRRC